MTSRNITILVLIALLIISYFGYSYVGSYFDQRERMAWEEKFIEASKLLKENDSEAIKEFENAVDLAEPYSLDEGKSKIYLGGSWRLIDPVKGVEILKEVAQDDSYDKFQRSVAILTILNLYEASYTDEVFNAIFSGSDPWPTFYKNGDKEQALLKLFQWADELYPTVVSNYKIAAWYILQLHGDRIDPSLGELTRETYLQTAKKHIKAGDKLFDLAFTIPQFPSPRSQMGIYASKAFLYGSLYQIEGNMQDRQTAETAYKRGLALGYAHISNGDLKEGLLRTTYSYAGFLAWLTIVKGEDRYAEISTLVTSLTREGPDSNFFSYVKRAATQNKLARRQASMIAKINLDFKRVLTSLDVPLEAL